MAVIPDREVQAIIDRYNEVMAMWADPDADYDKIGKEQAQLEEDAAAGEEGPENVTVDETAMSPGNNMGSPPAGDTADLNIAEIDGSGPAFSVGRVRQLHELNPSRPGAIYDLFPDGERLVINHRLGGDLLTRLVLVQNWTEELR